MILYGSLQAKTIKNNKNQDKQYTVPTRPGFHQTYLWQFPVDFVASPWAKMQICCPAGSKRTWPGHLRAVYLPKRFREKHLHDVLLNQYTSIISSVNVTSQDGNFEGWVRVIFFGQSVQRISPFSPDPSCYPQGCYLAAWSTPKDLVDSPCPQLPAFCLLACHPECPSQTAPAGLFPRSSSTRCSLAGVHRSTVGVNVCFFWARSGEFRHFKNEREKQQLQNKWLSY